MPPTTLSCPAAEPRQQQHPADSEAPASAAAAAPSWHVVVSAAAAAQGGSRTEAVSVVSVSGSVAPAGLEVSVPPPPEAGPAAAPRDAPTAAATLPSDSPPAEPASDRGVQPTLSFGSLPAGETLSRTFLLRNGGRTAVRVSYSVADAGGGGVFTCGSPGCVLSPGAVAPVAVTFTPSGQRVFRSILTVHSGAASGRGGAEAPGRSVVLSGAGVAPSLVLEDVVAAPAALASAAGRAGGASAAKKPGGGTSPRLTPAAATPAAAAVAPALAGEAATAHLHLHTATTDAALAGGTKHRAIDFGVVMAGRKYSCRNYCWILRLPRSPLPFPHVCSQARQSRLYGLETQTHSP